MRQARLFLYKLVSAAVLAALYYLGISIFKSLEYTRALEPALDAGDRAIHLNLAIIIPSNMWIIFSVITGVLTVVLVLLINWLSTKTDAWFDRIEFKLPGRVAKWFTRGRHS